MEFVVICVACVFANNPNVMNVRVGNERSAMQCNVGRLNEVGLQDTGAAVRNDAAKAKGMTACCASQHH